MSRLSRREILVISGYYSTLIAVWLVFGSRAMLAALLVITGVGCLAMLLVMAGERKRRLRMVGRCVCGYDLRATPDRCPECGRFPQRRRPWYTLSS